MGAERHVFEQADEDAERRADERAEADVAAGRLISHEAVKKWLNDIAAGRPTKRPMVGD